jgi:hypothetical protein
MQVLESSNDQHCADGNADRHGIGASKEAIGDDSNGTPLSGSCAPHDVAQVAIHSRVASQWTGGINVQVTDMATY